MNAALELGKIGREEQCVLNVGVTPHIFPSRLVNVSPKHSGGLPRTSMKVCR
ncbi:MAG: hypothetical protein V4632_08305 [Pseudomonadota bacterium]